MTIERNLSVMNLLRWATEDGSCVEYIQSGKPHQNVYIERYNRTIRYVA